MTYVVTKMIKGNPYLYLVRSERDGDRVRQVFVRYIGRDSEEARAKASSLATEEVPIARRGRPPKLAPASTTQAVEQPIKPEETTAGQLSEQHGLNIKITEGAEGGEYTGGTVFVGKDTTPIQAFAANWVDKNATDFKTSKSYPKNVTSEAHEVAHGLFSKNPEAGHKAIAELKALGVPDEVAFESLVDTGGLYLLEPDAITNPKVQDVISNWLTATKPIEQPIETTPEPTVKVETIPTAVIPSPELVAPPVETKEEAIKTTDRLTALEYGTKEVTLPIKEDFSDVMTLREEASKLEDGLYTAGDNYVYEVKDGKVKVVPQYRSRYDYDLNKYVYTEREKTPSNISEVPIFHGSVHKGLSLSDMTLERSGQNFSGVGGNEFAGLYFTTRPSDAKGYASLGKEGGTLLEARISPKAKVIDYKDVGGRDTEQLLNDKIDVVLKYGKAGDYGEIIVLNPKALSKPTSETVTPPVETKEEAITTPVESEVKAEAKPEPEIIATPEAPTGYISKQEPEPTPIEIRGFIEDKTDNDKLSMLSEEQRNLVKGFRVNPNLRGANAAWNNTYKTIDVSSLLAAKKLESSTINHEVRHAILDGLITNNRSAVDEFARKNGQEIDWAELERLAKSYKNRPNTIVEAFSIKYEKLSEAFAKSEATPVSESKPEPNINALLTHLRKAPQSKSGETYLRKTFGDEAVEKAHQEGFVTRTPKGIYTDTVKGREMIKNIPQGKVNLFAEGKRILSESITMKPETTQDDSLIARHTETRISPETGLDTEYSTEYRVIEAPKNAGAEWMGNPYGIIRIFSKGGVEIERDLLEVGMSPEAVIKTLPYETSYKKAEKFGLAKIDYDKYEKGLADKEQAKEAKERAEQAGYEKYHQAIRDLGSIKGVKKTNITYFSPVDNEQKINDGFDVGKGVGVVIHKVGNSNEYAVTHINTGLAMGHNWKNRAEAIALAKSVANITDWSQFSNEKEIPQEIMSKAASMVRGFTQKNLQDN